MSEAKPAAAKPKKDKKPVIEMEAPVHVAEALFNLNRECKVLEAEREFLQQELEAFFDPDDDDDTKTSATYAGDGTPDSVIHVLRKRYTEISISSSPSDALLEFLESEDALDMVNVQAPFEALVVRRDRASGAEIKEEGIERAKTVLPKGPEASAREYWRLGKEIGVYERKIDALKNIVQKMPEFSELETSTYKFPGGETLSVTKDPGGKKTVSQSALVERFGEEIVERFGVERETTLFKVETEAERSAAREMFGRIAEKERLEAGRKTRMERESGGVGIEAGL